MNDTQKAEIRNRIIEKFQKSYPLFEWAVYDVLPVLILGADCHDSNKERDSVLAIKAGLNVKPPEHMSIVRQITQYIDYVELADLADIEKTIPKIIGIVAQELANSFIEAWE